VSQSFSERDRLISLGQPAQASGADATLIRGVSVFDGMSFIGIRDVRIDNGLVTEVGTNLRSDSEFIDGDGKTLLPGLIDCHVHIWGDGLGQALASGVTTVIDMFMDVSFAAEMRREQKNGPVTHRADLVSAGNLATAPGGHGTQYGVPVATLNSPDEAEEFVAARIKEGSDFIKIIWEMGDGSWPTLDEPTIEAVADSAHQKGKIAVIHITRYEHARRAAALGVDGLAHIFSDKEPEADFGPLVAGAEIFVVPTLSVVASACGVASGASLVEDEGFSGYLTPQQESSLRQSASWSTEQHFDNALAAVRMLHESGVTILAGTDAPNTGTAYGVSMHRELELLADCGLTAEEALASATSRAAQTFGLEDRGTIQSGKAADLLLVEGDPSKSLSDTRRIASIFKRGVKFDREEYRSRVEVTRVDAQNLAPPPDAEALEAGVISNFEDGLTARFGSGWSVTTDAIMGGASVAEMEIIDGGADGTDKAMRVSGEVREGYLFPWAGAMFSPGPAQMQPADLSSRKGISFWVRGEGGTLSFGIMAVSHGFRPLINPFSVSGDWTRHEFSFEDLGLDATDITGVMFTCNARGSFAFEIDEVRI
jgi:imidazolonepropionase-like amidohydrolase